MEIGEKKWSKKRKEKTTPVYYREVICYYVMVLLADNVTVIADEWPAHYHAEITSCNGNTR